MRQTLGGLLVPIITPFDRVTGDVAPVALRSNARALLDQGVAGILATGSTGEAALLSDEEYEQVIAWLRDVVPEDRLLVAGAGRESTRATIAACRTAGKHGADAVLVRPPAYYGPSLSSADLIEHFRSVAEASPVPVLAYNIPKYTHLALHESVIGALSEHPNLVGAKDSSGDLKNFAAYRKAAPEWALFIGSGSHYYAALELGAVGGVLAVAMFAAQVALAVDSAFGHGDRPGAGAAQERLSPLNQAVVSQRGVPGIKAASDLVGLDGGPVRAPLRDLRPADRDAVEAVLRDAGLAA